MKFLTQQKDLEDKIFELNQKLEHEFTTLSSNLDKVRREMVDVISSDKESFEGQIELINKIFQNFLRKLVYTEIILRHQLRMNIIRFLNL